MRSDVVARIIEQHPHRSERLFTEFLPRGYRLTALRRHHGELDELLLTAKVLLGSLITFHDDLADHPTHFDPTTLDYLYGVSTTRPTSDLGIQRLTIAQSLGDEFGDAVRQLPHHRLYARLLCFDLDQFYSANRYSALLRVLPGLANVTESRHFGAFNMGMIAAATLDLMAIGPIAPQELAAIRETVFLGQRAARISNVITTLAREQDEGDLSNEALIGAASGCDVATYVEDLESEHAQHVLTIQRMAVRCRAVDLGRYGRAIQALHDLHREFDGTI